MEGYFQLAKTEEFDVLPDQQQQQPIDHRKKRRNRTTQSCLSCHQNKRKVNLLRLSLSHSN